MDMGRKVDGERPPPLQRASGAEGVEGGVVEIGEPRTEAGPPEMGRPVQSFYVPEEVPGSSPGPTVGRGVLILGVAAVGLIGFGVAKPFLFEEGAGARAGEPVESILSRQQEAMREAMQMAREAQEMQRAQTEHMRRAMMEGEYGSVDEGEGR